MDSPLYDAAYAMKLCMYVSVCAMCMAVGVRVGVRACACGFSV